MSIITKRIEVVPYNSDWPKMFKLAAAEIQTALGDHFIAIHHVGSTSVPGLAAKPKIDIIAVVQNLDFSYHELNLLGYTYRGGFNLPLRKSFTKRPTDTNNLNINLHIFEENDPEIELNILFRDYLRQNQHARDAYEALKYNLILEESSHQKNASIYTDYTLGKHDFIQNILKQSGFTKSRFVLCTHYSEWAAYHRIQKEQIFDPINVIYDKNHPSLKADNHFHFVLYKGTNIACAAHVEFLNEHEAVLLSLATDNIYQKQQLDDHMIMLLGKWVQSQGRSLIKLIHKN